MVSPLERSASPIQNPYTDPSLIESDADKSYSQSTLLQTAQQHQQHLGCNDSAIVQREREINDIAKGIIELSDIFRELQTMIIDQGTMLDRIDFNVERMTVDVKGADKELKVVCLPFLVASLSIPSANLRLGHELPETNNETKNNTPFSSPSCWDVHYTPCQTKETC